MRLLAGLLLSLLAVPAFAQKPVPAPMLGLTTDTEARWVAFELTPQDQIRFTLELDGRPVTAMLDTAVSVTTISRAYASRTKLRTRGERSATAIGGAVGIEWADSAPISLGGLRRTGGKFAVLDLAQAATGGDAVEMLVGIDLVGGYALDIDYPARRFRLLRSGRMPFPGASAPLGSRNDLSFYLTEMDLHGVRVRPMVIDTGDGGAITVSSEAWRPHGALAPRMTTTMSHGLAGPVVTELAVLPEVKIGALTARNVAINVERTGGYSSRIGVAGRIGSGLLKRYLILLDPTAGHMILSPGPEADLPPVRSTSGLLVEAQGGALVVLHVMKGGPGEAAGWRAGERDLFGRWRVAASERLAGGGAGADGDAGAVRRRRATADARGVLLTAIRRNAGEDGGGDQREHLNGRPVDNADRDRDWRGACGAGRQTRLRLPARASPRADPEWTHHRP